MRTLHADLTTAQKAASATPYVSLVFTSRDRATTRTYLTTSSPNRIVHIQQSEGATNDHISAPGEQPFAVLIRLRDNDNALGVLEWRGYRVDIGWGFNTGSGNRDSLGPPVFVRTQRRVSIAGQIYLELQCISLWGLLAVQYVNAEVDSVLAFSGESVRHILQRIMGGSACAAAILDDGGAFTDYTTEADNSTADNVFMLPAVPAVNDAFYFGSSTRFNTISIDLTTVGAGTWTLAWAYWNGSSWAVIDTIASSPVDISTFTKGELQVVRMPDTISSTWATTTINGQGPFYYLKVTVSAYTSITTQPKATRIRLGHDTGLWLDTSDGDQGDDFQPEHTTDYRVTQRQLVEQILEMTEMGIFVRQDGFHLRYIDNAEAGNDYAYDANHNSFSSIQSQSVVIPNEIKYVDLDPANADSGVVSDSYEDTTASGLIGKISAVVLQEDVSAADALKLATRHIRRLNRDAAQGMILAPMNCGQEVWDLVSVTDQRTTATFTGRASQLIRTYDPGEGVYNIQIIMGGAVVVTRAEITARHEQVVRARRATASEAEDRYNKARADAGLGPEDRGAVLSATEETLQRKAKADAAEQPVLELFTTLKEIQEARAVKAGVPVEALATPTEIMFDLIGFLTRRMEEQLGLRPTQSDIDESPYTLGHFPFE